MERWIKEIETLRFDRLFVYLGLVLSQLYSLQSTISTKLQKLPLILPNIHRFIYGYRSNLFIWNEKN